ncbi:MAG: acyl-CoA dehydrogenase family protein [Alphaproteobacteria bacterium]|nr:acyl-CoA dehydrogenase family protein [Alphaproteobacteria bacterium]
MTNAFKADAERNQPPPFEDVNLFASDAALQDAVTREGGGHANRSLIAFGLVCGSQDAFERGQLANHQPPRLETHDYRGNRIDRVEFCSAYHELMETSCAEGLNCAAWLHLAGRGQDHAADQQVARAAGFYLAAQTDSGHLAAISTTHSAVPALLTQPSLAEVWLPKIASRSYDRRREPFEDKHAVTIGLGIGEKQAGSDLAGLSTMAQLANDNSGRACEYLLTGHKWFLSAPMSDAFIMLAQTPQGPGCFLVPAFTDDGERNAVQFVRLKRKLGTHSGATAEAELTGAFGWLIGEPGQGFGAINEVMTHIRLDAAISSAALMRQALAQAIHHCEHRCAHGRRLSEHPLMEQVLADLALDVEAAVALVFRLARAFDRHEDEHASAWRRLMTPVTKYWTGKISAAVIAEAMECMGGNAYVEELPIARLYRDAPAAAIWGGCGNELAQDVLRVLQRDPDVASVVMDDLAEAAADDAHLKAAHARLESILHEPRLLDGRGRALAEGLAVLAAGTILRAHAPAAIADAFIATRMGSLSRQTYGQGVDWAETKSILQRASPNC